MLNTDRTLLPTIGVYGLGYVGIPLVFAFVEKGFRVIGFDVDETKVAALNASKSYMKHIPDDAVAHIMATGLFEPTADFRHTSRVEALLLCVPTPLTAQREPDMTFIESTARAIVPYLCKGQIVVLESTTYPGTTDGLLRSILEESGLRAGKDFNLAYSPERADPGNREFSTARIPKVVGGLTDVCRDRAYDLYAKIVPSVVKMSSTRAAEAVKLTENIFRAVNIALVNELKVVFERMDIDVWEVIEGAKTKPFGYMPFYPGPGMGGHCIPIDPFYLTWKAREFGCSTRFIELAGEINVSMPDYVLQRLVDALNAQGKPLKNSRVLVLGVSYKKDVDDTRESPALTIIEKLMTKGCVVSYHDPFVARIGRTREHMGLMGMESVELTPAVLAACDAALIVTDHTNVDYSSVVQHAPLIIDTRNVTARIAGAAEKVVKA